MLKYVILSDTHIGMSGVNTKILINYIKSINTEFLILNGDIIDMDAINRGHKWTKNHTSAINELIKLSKKTKIIYLRGNHDDHIKNIFKIKLKNIQFKERHIINVKDKKILILHGDIFDSKIIKNKIVYQIGSIGYDFVLTLNIWYNKIRNFLGQPFKSISKPIKENVKSILSLISDFENNAINEAKMNGCNGVICGHIHTPSRKLINNVIYLNSGDWIENFSAIEITTDGEISLKFSTVIAESNLPH